MIKRLAVILLTVFMCLAFCSCSSLSFEVTDMLQSPELGGDRGRIADTLKENIGNDVVLRYPHSGNYRSAIILRDINSDGSQEALAFYSRDKESGADSMHIALLTPQKNGWKIASDVEVAASAVSSVDFYDFSGNDIDDIVVGWDIYTDDTHRLTVFRADDGVLVQRTDELYSAFTVTDINADGKNEIFIAYCDAAGKKAYASVLSVGEEEVEQLSETALDASAKEYISLTVAGTADGKTAVYLDALKPGGSTFTELIFMEGGKLKNPFYDQATATNTMTVRSFEITVSDINGDDIPEIPCPQALPSVSGEQSNKDTLLTVWRTYGADGFSDTAMSLVNYTDGYMFLIPDDWADSITAVRDAEESRCTIYRYDRDTALIVTEVLSVRVMPTDEWDNVNLGSAYTELQRSEGNAYLVRTQSGGIYPSAEEAGESFRLIKDGRVVSPPNSDKEADRDEKNINS